MVPVLVVGAGLATATAGAFALEVIAESPTDAGEGDSGWIVVIWIVAAVSLGRITAGWQERVRRTEQVVAELERGRGAAVRLATARERQALAAELHDTVAHAMPWCACRPVRSGVRRPLGGPRST